MVSGLLISICKLAQFNGNALTDPSDRLGVVDGWDVTASQRSIQGQTLQSHSDSIFFTWRRQRALICRNAQWQKLCFAILNVYIRSEVRERSLQELDRTINSTSLSRTALAIPNFRLLFHMWEWISASGRSQTTLLQKSTRKETLYVQDRYWFLLIRQNWGFLFLYWDILLTGNIRSKLNIHWKNITVCRNRAERRDPTVPLFHLWGPLRRTRTGRLISGSPTFNFQADFQLSFYWGQKEDVWITHQRLQTGPGQRRCSCEPIGQAGRGGWLVCNCLSVAH